MRYRHGRPFGSTLAAIPPHEQKPRCPLVIRLLHVTTTDISLDLLLGPQLRAFAAAGFEVHTASAPGPHVAALTATGLVHHPLRHATRALAPHRDVAAFAELHRLFRRLRPDIVHTHNPKPGVYGRLAARVAGVPLVVNTQHGLYAQPTDRAARRLPVYALERLAAAASHVELVQSPEDIDTLVRLGVPRSKLRLLGNGVDLERFAPPAPGVRAAVRAELGVGDDQVVVGAVGRLVWEKGYAELLTAARALLSRRDDVAVVVAGPFDPDKGDPLDVADVTAAEHAGVRFLGMRDDPERLYAAFDLYVLASHREGFPRSAMEAAASGLPVVATDIRGCRQVVDPGVTGELVPVRDPAALEAAIERLVDDPGRRRTMGAAAVAKAATDFDQRTVISRTLDAYASPAGSPRHERRLEAHARRPSRSPPTGPGRPGMSLALKRSLDLVGAVIGLVLGAPVLGVLALVVRLRLGRPALFHQERIGRDDRTFTLVKLRSMTDQRGPDGALLPDAERLTPLGRLLRSSSLDELPELWNVACGHMSLVGPRPLPTTYRHRYTSAERRRHGVRPGLTGWAQVNGRNAVDWDERLAMDVWYVDHRSTLLDLRILARTIGAVVSRGGISGGGEVTMAELRPHLADRARP